MENDSTGSKRPQWTGARLTYGSFLVFARQVSGIVEVAGYAELMVETEGPELADAVRRLGDVLHKSRSFAAPRQLAAADVRRDALWLALWYAWRFTNKLGTGHPLGETANRIGGVMAASKGLYRKSLRGEASEMDALARRFESDECREALATLGLDKIACAMLDANEEMKAAAAQKLAEFSGRLAERSAGEYAVLRKRIAVLLRTIFERVGAKNLLAPTDASLAAAKSLCGAIARVPPRRLPQRVSGAKQGSPPLSFRAK